MFFHSTMTLLVRAGRFEATALVSRSWQPSGAWSVRRRSSQRAVNRFARTAAVVLIAGCGGSDSKPGITTPPPPTTQHTLTIMSTTGVSSTPGAGTSQFASGARVAYTVSTAQGAENLRVYVDSQSASVSGTLVMDRDHTIAAVADLVPAPAPAVVQADVDAASAALAGLKTGAVRPMDVYRRLVATTTAMAAKVSADSIPRLMRLARLQAFTPDDAPTIARALLEIADSLRAAPASASLSAPSRSAMSPFEPSRQSSAAPAPLVTFVYVNGIFAHVEDANTTVGTYLMPVLQAAGFPVGDTYAAERYYNPTAEPTDAKDLAVVICLDREEDALSEGEKITDTRSCDQRARDAFGQDKSDLSEAYLQVLARTLARRDAIPPTAAGLADRIETLAKTTRVVLIGHSQGNLFIDEAYRALESRGTVNPRCVGTVSLAPPLPVRPLANGNPVSASIVQGKWVRDILLLLELNKPGTLPGITTIPSNQNALSEYFDSAYESFSNFWILVMSLGVSSLHANQAYFAGALNLHYVNVDYLGANRATTIVGLKEQVANVMHGCVTGLQFSTEPTSGAVGAALPAIEVRVLGPDGATASQANVPVTLSLGTNPSGGHLSGTLTVTTTSGVARFTNVSIDKPAESYTMVASSPGAPSITSNAFSVIAAPGQPAKLAFAVQPSGAAPGATIAPAVQVTIQDATGNTVTGATNAITLALGQNTTAATLSGTLTQTAVNGVATFPDLKIDKAGTYALVATAAGVASDTSGSLIVSAASDMLAYYPFNGSTSDLSGNGHDGVGTDVTPAPDRFGTAGASLSFNGSSSEVVVSDAASLQPTTLTIAAWVYLDAYPPSGDGAAILDRTNGWVADGYRLSVSGTTRQFQASLRVGTTFMDVDVPGSLQLGTWYHIAVTFDGSTQRAYVNGQLASAVPRAGAITYEATPTDLGIGRRQTGVTGAWLAGRIADLRLYNRALSDAEVLALAR